jgi:hypothetical protein
MDRITEDKRYHVKLIILYETESVCVWEGLTKFHIQTRPNGDISVLCPKDSPIGWAEYCKEDMEEKPNGQVWCVCEDYLMVITS